MGRCHFLPLFRSFFGCHLIKPEKIFCVLLIMQINVAISTDGDYELGRIIQENRHHRLVFVEMVIGTVISGILLALIGKSVFRSSKELIRIPKQIKGMEKENTRCGR